MRSNQSMSVFEDGADGGGGGGLHELSEAELALWFLLYGLIASLSISGNLLVLYVFYSCSRLRTITNYFIINLAVADMVTGMLAIPFKFQAALLQKWFLPPFMCSLVPFIETMSLSVSVFTLSASAVDRFRAVSTRNCKALSGSRARILLLLIWAVSIAFSLPYGIDHRVFEFLTDDGANSSVHVCLPMHEDETWWKAYNVYLTIIQYFVPLVIINCTYCFIGYQVWLTKPVMKASDHSFEKNKRTVIKMLVIVVAVFTLCWLPYEVYLVLNEVAPKVNEYYYINVIFFCFHWLAMSNSCLNPIIYGIYNKKFQHEYARVFSKCCGKRFQLESGDGDPPSNTTEVASSLPLPTKNTGLEFIRASNCHIYIFTELGKDVT